MLAKNSNLKIILLHLVLLGLYCAPFFAVEVPVLVDYTNHLARMYIVSHYNELPVLQKFYDVKHELAPYLGIDAVFYLLSFLDIYTAGHVYIAICFTLVTIGVCLTNYAVFKRLRYESLLCYPFFLNPNISIGLINYYLAIGLVLIGFAIYLMLPEKRKYLFLFFYSLFMFFIHLFGLMCFLGLVGLYLLSTKQVNFKVIAQFASCLVLPVIIVLGFTTEHQLSVDKETILPKLLNLEELIGRVTISGFQSRILNLVTLAFFALLVLFRTVKIHKFGLMILFIIILTFLIPHSIYGIWSIQCRLPPFMGLLFAACVTLAKPRAKYIIIPLYLLLTAATLAHTYGYLKISDDAVKELRQSFREIPKGSKILSASNFFVTNQFVFAPTLAIIENQHFVNDVYTGIPPLKAKPEYDAIAGRIGSNIPQKMLLNYPADKPSWMAKAREMRVNEYAFYYFNWRNDFDYVVIGAPHFNEPLPPELELIKVINIDLESKAPIFAIYKVRKDFEHKQ